MKCALGRNAKGHFYGGAPIFHRYAQQAINWNICREMDMKAYLRPSLHAGIYLIEIQNKKGTFLIWELGPECSCQIRLIFDWISVDVIQPACLWGLFDSGKLNIEVEKIPLNHNSSFTSNWASIGMFIGMKYGLFNCSVKKENDRATDPELSNPIKRFWEWVACQNVRR